MWSSPLLLAVLYRSPPPPSHAPSHPLMRLTGRCMLRLAVADDDNDGVLDPDASPALLRRLAIAPNHRALKLAHNDNCPKGEPSSNNQSPVRCEVPGPQHNTSFSPLATGCLPSRAPVHFWFLFFIHVSPFFFWLSLLCATVTPSPLQCPTPPKWTQ